MWASCALWDVSQHPSPYPVDAGVTTKLSIDTAKCPLFLTESPCSRLVPQLATQQSLLEALKRQAPPDSWAQCQNSWGGVALTV